MHKLKKIDLMISDNENIKHLDYFDKDETLSTYSNT